MSRRPMPCGFCLDGNHRHCPGTVKDATTPPKGSADRTWTCPCADPSHEPQSQPGDLLIVPESNGLPELHIRRLA